MARSLPLLLTERKAQTLLLACLLALAPLPAAADEIGQISRGEILVPYQPTQRYVDRAPLWSHTDASLQQRLEATLSALGLAPAVEGKRLAAALVDITNLKKPRVAAVNGDAMMYAASLPKIAILLAAFQQVAEGRLVLDREVETHLTQMIRRSSNRSASLMMDRVGKQYIADVLQSPRYKLYDPDHNGGLWVGKNYAQAGLWRRDPLHHLSHGATAMQVARFYYLLETGNLVSPRYSRKMKSILSASAIQHKFVRGIGLRYPHAGIYRKSGTWRQFHADSAIIEHHGRRYIAVGLCESAQGGRWLQQMVSAMDDLILSSPLPGIAESRETSLRPWSSRRRLRMTR
jgi:beta-lactamase class A